MQDYNAEALTELAAPNLQLNARLRQTRVRPARFFSGSWATLGQLLECLGAAASFDLVVSAETVYNQACMQALHDCIRQVSRYIDAPSAKCCGSQHTVFRG